MIPYGHQSIDDEDIDAVVSTLRSDWLTTGPAVTTFESDVASYVGVAHAVALSSGTAALHAALYAAGVTAGDEVIVPPMTFAATANAAVYLGAIPVFADVRRDTLLIDPAEVEKKISSRTRAIIAVDYAGHPCDYENLSAIARKHGLVLVADSCHSLGARYQEKLVGNIADLTVFSFHPVKHITTGEGGMVVTNEKPLSLRMQQFRNHGIDTDHRQRAAVGSWYYEMTDLGYNYRISDIQCSLGSSQLRKLPHWLRRRAEIASKYDNAFAGNALIQPLKVMSEVCHAYHLYVIRLHADRDRVFRELRDRGIGANVHYIPVHLHPFYRQRFNLAPGMYPVAEAAYRQILSLPIFPKMTDQDVFKVISEVTGAAETYAAAHQG